MQDVLGTGSDAGPGGLSGPTHVARPARLDAHTPGGRAGRPAVEIRAGASGVDPHDLLALIAAYDDVWDALYAAWDEADGDYFR